MSRGVVIAAIGVAILIIALALNATLLDAPGPEGAPVEASAPAPTEAPPPAPAETVAAAPDAAPDKAVLSELATAEAPPEAAPEEAPEPPAAPAFTVARISPDGAAVLAGSAAPGAMVAVLVDGEGVGEAEADHSGEWVLVPDQALAPGDRQIALSARNPDGAVTRSEQIVAIALRNDGAKPLAVLTDAAELGDAVILQQPERAEATAPAASLEADAPNVASLEADAPNVASLGADAPNVAIIGVDYDDAGAYVVSGRGTPGGSLRLYRDTVAVGETAVDDDGLWTVRPDERLRLGVYTLRADLLAGEAVGARAEVSFVREVEAMQLTQDGRVIVQPGNSLWRIARRLYGNGAAFTVIYQANRDQIRDPDLIYPNQVFLAPAREG